MEGNINQTTDQLAFFLMALVLRMHILTDLWKAFDCVCHDLLIAKLNAYGFDQNALKAYLWLP